MFDAPPVTRRLALFVALGCAAGCSGAGTARTALPAGGDDPPSDRCARQRAELERASRELKRLPLVLRELGAVLDDGERLMPEAEYVRRVRADPGAGTNPRWNRARLLKITLLVGASGTTLYGLTHDVDDVAEILRRLRREHAVERWRVLRIEPVVSGRVRFSLRLTARAAERPTKSARRGGKGCPAVDPVPPPATAPWVEVKEPETGSWRRRGLTLRARTRIASLIPRLKVGPGYREARIEWSSAGVELRLLWLRPDPAADPGEVTRPPSPTATPPTDLTSIGEGVTLAFRMQGKRRDISALKGFARWERRRVASLLPALAEKAAAVDLARGAQAIERHRDTGYQLFECLVAPKDSCPEDMDSPDSEFCIYSGHLDRGDPAARSSKVELLRIHRGHVRWRVEGSDRAALLARYKKDRACGAIEHLNLSPGLDGQAKVRGGQAARTAWADLAGRGPRAQARVILDRYWDLVADMDRADRARFERQGILPSPDIARPLRSIHAQCDLAGVALRSVEVSSAEGPGSDFGFHVLEYSFTGTRSAVWRLIYNLRRLKLYLVPIRWHMAENQKKVKLRIQLAAAYRRQPGVRGGGAKSEAPKTVTSPAVTRLVPDLRRAEAFVRRRAAFALGGLEAAALSAVPELTAGLRDRDTRDAAREAIVSIGPAAVRHLLGTVALDEPSFQQHVEIVGQVLSRLGQRAVPNLVRGLVDHRVSDVVARAVGRALARAKKPPVARLIRIVRTVAARAQREAKDDDPIFDSVDVSLCEKIGAALGEIGAASELRALLGDSATLSKRAALTGLSRSGPRAAAAAGALMTALGDRDEYVRIGAAGALARIGASAARATPALVKALADESEAVREAAARALGVIGGARVVVPVLIKRLEDRSRDVRAAAAGALGSRGETAAAAVKTLWRRREQIGRDYSGNIATRALLKVGRPAAHHLVQRLAAGDDGERQAAAELLHKFGGKHDQRTVRGLGRALDDGQADVRRWAAWTLAEQASTAGARGRLIRALRSHGDASVRGFAARALGRSGSRTLAWPALVKALTDSAAGVRASAVAGLARLGDPRAQKVLVGALDDPDDQVRYEAMLALRGRGPAALRLVEMLADMRSQKSRRLLQAVAKKTLGPPAEAAVPQLADALPRPSQGFVAAEVLAMFGAAGVKALIPSLGSKSVDARMAAAHGLGKGRAPAAIRPLVSLLTANDKLERPRRARPVEDLNHFGREAAISALVAIGAGSVNPLITAAAHGRWEVREAAARALGQLRAAAAVARLAALLVDGNPFVRCSAALALRQIGSRAALAALSKHATSSDLAVRFVSRASSRSHHRAVP